MKTFYVVIFVFGEVVWQSPRPMTWDDCVLQAAYRIVQLEQFAASGRPVPEQYGGSAVTRKDVEVKCLRRRWG
jgi:hypothetical protein